MAIYTSLGKPKRAERTEGRKGWSREGLGQERLEAGGVGAGRVGNRRGWGHEGLGQEGLEQEGLGARGAGAGGAGDRRGWGQELLLHPQPYLGPSI